jgi:predicted dehydrogenase
MIRQPDLDAVSIVTPPNLHHEMAITALGAGKHVLCEKPFAMNRQQAKQMWDKAKETGLTAMVTHEFRFIPARAYIKELLQQGYLGELHNVSVALFSGSQQRGKPAPLRWRDQYSYGGGQLAGMGSHYIDCLRDWFGEITGVCGRVFNHDSERPPEADADNAFSFLVTFANGGWGTMSANFVAPFGTGMRIEIYGSEGMLSTPQPSFNPTNDGAVWGARFEEAGRPRELHIPEPFQLASNDGDPRLAVFRILAKRFREGISIGTSPPPNFYDGYRCQQIIDAVQGLTTPGRWVDLQ